MTHDAYRPGPIEGVSEEVQACIPHHGALHAYVWWATKTTHAPPWWHVAGGLTLVAHEAARWGYTIGSELEEKPSLWVAMLGPSAAGKSTAIKRAMGFYNDYLDAHDARDPFVMAEGSIQGVFEKLTEGHNTELGRTLGILHQDEFSRLLDTKQPVSEMLMQLSDNSSIERHKVSSRQQARAGQDAHDRLENPCLSAMFATTYASLRRITRGHHIDGGLYSRLLWFVADPKPESLQMLPNRRNAERRAALGAWADWHGWLLAEEAQNHRKLIEVPETVHWILEESLFEQARVRIGDDDRLNASRMRAVTQAYKIAGLLALTQGRTVVLSEDMDVAVNCVEKAQKGLERVDPELGGTEVMALTNLAFRAIQRRGTDGLTRSKLYPVLKTNKRWVDEVVHTLIDEGSIREITTKTGKRGRPSKRYVACGPERFTGSDEDVVPLHRPNPVDSGANGE